MPLKYIVDSLEGVDKAHHALYEKGADGKFTLQVEGVKTQGDVDAVQNALTKERNDHKATKTALTDIKTKYAPLGDRDPNDIASVLDRVPALEEAAAGKGVDQAKINDMVRQGVERGLAAKTAPMERELATLKQTNVDLAKTNDTLSTAQKHRTIDDQVRAAATALKVSEHALPDVIELLRPKFNVGEDGKVLNEAGLDPVAIITDAKKTKPHWWPLAQGAGAQGGNGGQHVADADNPWSHAGWNLTKQGAALTADRAGAAKLAEAAGHKSPIGAQRPAAPAAAAAR